MTETPDTLKNVRAVLLMAAGWISSTANADNRSQAAHLEFNLRRLADDISPQEYWTRLRRGEMDVTGAPPPAERPTP